MEQCGVYFIQCGRFVKIGMSQCIQQRLAEVQVMNPVSLRLARVELLSAAELLPREMRLHDRFAEYRHRGEWFRIEGRLAAYLTNGGAEETAAEGVRPLSELRRARFWSATRPLQKD